MNRYESFCEELFPDLYKIAYLITGDSSAASDLAVKTVIQGVHLQCFMRTLTDARIELMRKLYTACMNNSFDAPGYGKLAAFDYQDRCLVVLRHCSGLTFQDFCRVTGWSEAQARRQLAKMAETIQIPKQIKQQPR